ncbi:Vesicle transport protein [Paragonimus heterotremus]|uniref:Vesicle transport protein n=1 Tax=Paragonimus heterotremus TaxID=100268 RepID=A0A8J4SP00_9TREM|nr:Vesicle transport protein [Paragonimus heterotremus]
MLNQLLSVPKPNGSLVSSKGLYDEELLPEPLRKFLGSRRENANGQLGPPNDVATASLEIESQGRLASWFSQSDSDPLMPKGLSRRQRIIGFIVCLLVASLCLCLAVVFLPLLTTPFGMRKYALLHSLGSLLMLASFSFLWGPWNYMKSLVTLDRLPFTVLFFLSLFVALYAVLVWKSAVLAALAITVQLCLIFWQIIANIPGGRAGLGAMVRGGYWTLKGVARGISV